MKNLPYNRYFAELLGTFALTLAVGMSLLVEFPIPTPVVAAITIALFVYTLGPISGAHFNPAVTIGLMSVRKIQPRDAGGYIVAQVVGAMLAMLLAQALTGGTLGLEAANTEMVGLVEAIGAAVLVFGVSAVASDKVHSAATGIVVGWSLLLGIMLTAGLSNGVLNPAVALGLQSVSMMYLLGPIVGGLVGAWIYKYVSA